MGIPVFVTTCAREELRAGMALTVIGYWLRHRQVDRVIVLDAGADQRFWHTLGAWGHRPDAVFEGHSKLKIGAIPPTHSQRTRHTYAINQARTLGAQWFVQTDDDILPRPEFDLELAVGLADMAQTRTQRFGLPAARPFGMVGLALPNCNLPHTIDPDAHRAFPVQQPVDTVGAVGGCRLMSTDIDESILPPYEPRMRGYDCPIAEGIRAQGMAVGYFTDAAPRTFRATNLAGPLSVVWPYLAIPAEFPRAGGAEG